jgi:hypothetical protein
LRFQASTFGEELDGVGVLAQIDVDLGMLTIIFAFNAHSSEMRHLIAMLDASRFFMRGL